MKPNPQTPAPSALTGRRYWRSLDELADTPEFKEWLHREFPQGASEFEDGVSRRHFMKIMSASFALAGLGVMGAGCRRPEEKLEPFGQQPEGYVYGEPEYYATAMPTRTGAVPLVAKSYEGRPIKLEGNAKFPGSNGGTDRYAQASILDLYDPDRAKQFTKLNQGKMEAVSRDEALGFLDELSKKFAANQGEGLAFLAESSTSPSRARLQKLIAGKFPRAQWFACDAIDSGIHSTRGDAGIRQWSASSLPFRQGEGHPVAGLRFSGRRGRRAQPHPTFCQRPQAGSRWRHEPALRRRVAFHTHRR